MIKLIKKETAGKLLIIGGILALIGSLLIFLNSKSPLQLFIGSLGIFGILIGIFVNQGFYNKTFYLAFLGLIAFQGLILIYTFIFTPVYATETIFYFDVGLSVFYAFIFAYSILKDEKISVCPGKKVGELILIKNNHFKGELQCPE